MPVYDLLRASILDFKPRLENRCSGELFACSGRSGNTLPRPTLFYVAAKGDGFACYGRSSNEVPRPILIYVAAKKKGPHASPSDLQDEWPACRMIVPDAGGNRRGQDATKAA